MVATTKPLLSLCAGDVMSHNVTVIPQEMSLQGAARLLSRAQVSGAPVVDGDGRCIGVLSSVDFLHWAEHGAKATKPCPCLESTWEPWQMLDSPRHAETLVKDVMTANPVTVAIKAHVGDLAQMMLDAHIHRVIVVDAAKKPVGVVSSTDLLAALARANHAAEHPAAPAVF